MGSAGLARRIALAGVTVVSAVGGWAPAAHALAGSYTVDPVAVDECAGTVTVALTRHGLASATATVATADGTAKAGEDYTALNQPVTFRSGKATVQVPIVQDAAPEGDEQFTVTVKDVLLDTGSGAVTIDDDDPGPGITLASPGGVAENAGRATFVAGLTKASPCALALHLAGQDGTAVAGTDYGPVPASVTIPAGQTSAAVDVPIAEDAIDEDDETFGVTASPAVAGAFAPGAPASATATIVDDDAPPALSIQDAGIQEGNSGLTPLTFAVQLSAPSGREVRVSYATVDATAQAGSDYQARSGAVTFAPGQVTAAIAVPVLADTTPEPDEVLGVALAAPVNATIARAAAAGFIGNDDGPVTPGITWSSGSSVRDGTPPALRLSRLRFSRPRIHSATIACPKAERTCRGTFTVFTVPRGSLPTALRHERRLGQTLFAIPGGKAAGLTLRLSKASIRLLGQARHGVPVRGYVVARDDAGNVATRHASVTLRVR